MNTKQLIVLWYAGFALVAGSIWALAATERPWFALMVGVVIIAGLLLYTLRTHPEANKKLLAMWVVIPPTCLGIVGGLVALGVYLAHKPVRIPVSLVEVSDASLSSYPGDRDSAWIEFRVKNLSDKWLREVRMRILILDDEGNEVDRADVEEYVRVPPSERRTVHDRVYGRRIPDKEWGWTFRVLDVLAEP